MGSSFNYETAKLNIPLAKVIICIACGTLFASVVSQTISYLDQC